MTDKELDKLIKSKLAGTTYPYNPANWKAMEAMLDQAQAPATPFYWRQTAAILLFALLLAIPLLWQNTGTKNLPAAIQQESVVSDSPQTTPKEQPAVQSNSSNSQGLQNIADQVSVEPKDEGKAATSGTQISTSNDIGASGNSAFASAESSSGQRANLIAQAEPINTNRQQAIFLAVSDKHHQDIDIPQNYFLELMPMSLTPKPVVKPYIDPRALAKFDNRHEFSIQGGPSINRAYNSQTGTGWQLGLHYRYRLYSNLALTGSLNYLRTGDMGIQTVADSVFFGFGRTEVHTEKHYRQISSIRIPLKAEYNLSPKHIVTGGVFADVVTAVQMDMHKTTTPYKADPRVEQHSSAKQRKEFSDVNFGLSAGYFYRFDPRLSFGLNINYSLTDLTNDNYQKFEGDHRLLQSELVIRYRLF